MAMLAEPRRKQKWTLNPRGKQWSEDSNKFGQKMLEKMGWTSGKGLGAHEQGMTEHVRVKFKDDAGGIGYSKDDQDKYWTEHQENFNELLQNLQAVDEKPEESPKVNDNTELSGKSLELKSKQSRARVHYQKFTRGKDVNKYSNKDLANIFGKKDLTVKKEVEEVEEGDNVAPIGSADSTAGVLTIKGGNMSDYFKSKFPNFQLSRNEEKSSESESERHVGFGFSSPSIFSGDKSENFGKFTPKKRKSEFYVETPKKIVSDENCEESEGKLEKKLKKNEKKIKKTKIDDSCGENCTEIDEKKLKKRKNKKFNSENNSPANGDEENPENSEEKFENKSKFIFDNQALDLASPISGLKPKKKRKKEREPLECIPQSPDPSKIPRNSPESSKKVSNFVFENPALDLNSPESKNSGKKSKKLNLNSENNQKIENFIFENPALNLDSPDIPNKSKKIKKKKHENITIDNEENYFHGSPSVFEIPRENGWSNEALDLTDEASCKRRVTFNDEIEYNTDFKRKKSRKKLDKFEVDNEKLRKKNQKKEAEAQSEGFVNPALDVDVVDDETIENEENERKSKSERRRKRRISSLETIAEIPEEEKIEDSSSEATRKKRRRGESEGRGEGNVVEEEGKVRSEDNEEILGFVDEFESPRMVRTGKSKRTLKNLFAKSPILDFNGANINEIKGYGLE